MNEQEMLEVSQVLNSRYKEFAQSKGYPLCEVTAWEFMSQEVEALEEGSARLVQYDPLELWYTWAGDYGQKYPELNVVYKYSYDSNNDAWILSAA